MACERPPLPTADTLFERAPCGLVVTREDGNILRANQTFCAWLGLDPATLTGRRFHELLTMGGRIFHQTHWAPLMKMQGSVCEVKLDLIHRDGRIITMLLNGVRQENSDGACWELALFGTIERDRYERELLHARHNAEQLLAERTAAENALHQAQAELAISYENTKRRALFAEQMVAIASHDLKNPLTAIRMASGLLERGQHSLRELQLLQSISSSTERAQRMIADLLDFASVRIGQGISIKRQPTAIPSLLDESVAELRVTFVDARLRHLSRGAGSVDLDPDRIQQMIGNLVANSVAYGDARYPVTLTSDLDERGATLSVHNHGLAIPASVIPSLFEPMTRASDRDHSVRSVGLGLFIVREIVTAHGGTVVVRSDAVHGTTFTLFLPQ